MARIVNTYTQPEANGMGFRTTPQLPPLRQIHQPFL